MPAFGQTTFPDVIKVLVGRPGEEHLYACESFCFAKMPSVFHRLLEQSIERGEDVVRLDQMSNFAWLVIYHLYVDRKNLVDLNNVYEVHAAAVSYDLFDLQRLCLLGES